MPAPPVLPSPPPGEYQQYLQDLVRVLNLWFQTAARPDVQAFGNILLLNLPTSATGLRPGTLWNDSGTIKIAE